MEVGIFVKLLIFLGCSCWVVDGSLDDTPPTDSPKEPKEYCDQDEFRPRCGPNEVIVIRDATYGRYTYNRCVRSTETVGCYFNALEHLDYWCSGRRSCKSTIHVPNSELHRAWDASKLNRCPSESSFHLNASYDCVKVEKNACSQCETSNAKVTDPKGYLASIVTAETQDHGGCGASRCPWSIQVQPGQVINVTLLDFSVAQPQRSGSSNEGCSRYLLIKERANPKDIQVCGGKKRETNLYLSVSNTIEIHMISQEAINWRGQFMVFYEAVGCPDIIPPKYSRMKRNGNKLDIDCPGTDQSWTLNCVDNAWQGRDKLGKCPPIPGLVEPEPPISNNNSIFSATLFNLPMGVLMALVIAVAVIMGVFILTTGVVCLKRHQYDVRHKEDASVYGAACSEFEFREIGGAGAFLVPMNAGQTSQTVKPRRPSTDLLMSVRDNTYALQDKRMESRPLPSIPTATSPHGSWRRDNPNRVFVQLHRTDSGSDGLNTNTSRQPAMMYRTGYPPQRGYVGGIPRGIPGGYVGGAGTGTNSMRNPQDGNHYFVLDPEANEEEIAAMQFPQPPPAHQQMPPPAHQQPPPAHQQQPIRPMFVPGRPPMADSRTVPRGHPRAPPVVEEKCTCDHSSPGSDHNHVTNEVPSEIPLRMVREGPKTHQTPLHSSDGKSSWP